MAPYRIPNNVNADDEMKALGNTLTHSRASRINTDLVRFKSGSWIYRIEDCPVLDRAKDGICSIDGLSLSELRSKSMNSGNQDKAEGTGKKAMGTVKEKTGEAIGNPDLRDRGTGEKIEGKVQDKVGDVKKVFEK